MTPLEVFAAQPAGLKAWLLWMFSINAASILFARRIEARWVLAAMVLNLTSMMVLLNLYGGGHHMSLPHAILWTPLLVYLARHARLIASQSRVYAVWAALLFCSNGASLAVDYANVAKWLLT